MKKKIILSVFIAILIIVSGYFIFNATRYNNITKIETNVTNEAILTNKDDIRIFMKCIHSKDTVKEEAFAIDANDKKIPNNVTIYYKDGSSESMLMGIDYVHKQLSYQASINDSIVYTLSVKNSEKLIEIFSKTK